MGRKTSCMTRTSAFYAFSLIFIGLMGILAGCGGGGSSGGGSPSSASLSGLYTGTTQTAYFKFPKFLDVANASSYSFPATTQFTISLSASVSGSSGGRFGINDNQGNTGGGTYTLSGNTVTITAGNFVINANSCSQSTSSNACLYTIKSGNGGLTVGSGTLSGTLEFYDSTNTLAFSTTFKTNSLSIPSIPLSKLEGQSATQTFGTQANPGGYNCATANVIVGSVQVTINGTSISVPCTTWNGYPGAATSGVSGVPANNASVEVVFCPTLGSDCTPPPSATSNGVTFVNKYNPSPMTVPSGALAFHVSFLSCGTNPGYCNGSNRVEGYIEPVTGGGGGVLGKVTVYSYDQCGNGATNPLIMISYGIYNAIVSSSGTTTGTYFYEAGIQPTNPTYTCGGTSTYYDYPISGTSFSSTQF